LSCHSLIFTGSPRVPTREKLLEHGTYLSLHMLSQFLTQSLIQKKNLGILIDLSIKNDF